jgi:hypothetical protein
MNNEIVAGLDKKSACRFFGGLSRLLRWKIIGVVRLLLKWMPVRPEPSVNTILIERQVAIGVIDGLF